MKKNIAPWTPEKLQFGCLMVLGVMELALAAFGPGLSYLPYFIVEKFSAVPALVFLGSVLVCRQSPLAKRHLLAGIGAVAWILAAQVMQYVGGEAPENIGMSWAAYLMVFPFAAVEQERGRGMKWMGGAAAAVGALLTLYAGLLKLGVLADGPVYWDGARLNALFHPNITACLLMMGLAFCLIFCFRVQQRWLKGVLLAAAALQFAAVALTNSRTNILMTCALLAGIVFFCIFRGGWKRLLLGGLAAVVVFVGAFALTDALYEAHYNQLVTEYLEEQAAAQVPEALSPSSASQASEAEPAVKLPSQSGQGSLLNDLRTLNGRTVIWGSAFQAARWNSNILLRGTAYVGTVISTAQEARGSFPVEHAHNSWVQMLMSFGLPGLMIGLYFGFLALRGALCLLLRLDVQLWKKSVALLVLCLLMAGFLEPSLFTGSVFYHFINVIFFLCTGYVDLWREELRHPESR
ncbi:MAG: O-antigen ligase family protein [Eubacteriales bacterium]|nr:O-antigen ligase family protein [Eubacteriales bacterium]